MEATREALKAAKECGITVCFEIVNRFEAYMITTAGEGVRFTEELDMPNASLLLDMFHMNIEEDRICDAICYAASHGKLGHLHISESNRRLPGLCQTDLDWSSILHTVSNTGYTGAVVLEPMVLMESPMAGKFRTWRNLTENPNVDTMLDEARRSIAFVKKILQNISI